MKNVFHTLAFALILFGTRAYALEAVYTVPVVGAPEAASNPTTAEISVGQNARTTLKYALPVDLVGKYEKPVLMTLESKVSTDAGVIAKFTSKIGWSVCMTNSGGLGCTSEYEHLRLDKNEIREGLVAKFDSNPAMLAAKFKAVKAFSTDPIGILQITCSVPSCGL